MYLIITKQRHRSRTDYVSDTSPPDTGRRNSRFDKLITGASKLFRRQCSYQPLTLRRVKYPRHARPKLIYIVLIKLCAPLTGLALPAATVFAAKSVILSKCHRSRVCFIHPVIKPTVSGYNFRY